MIPPTLTTERLVLRRVTQEDASAITAFAQHEDFGRYVPELPHPYTDKDAEAFIAMTHEKETGETDVNWGIVYQHKLIGGINLHEVSNRHKRCSVGYAIAKEHWGKGITSEALSAVLQYGFKALGMERIEAGVYHDNIASMRVLEKAGFQREGIRLKHGILRGTRRDLTIFGLLKENWR